jgi:large subunit ribosomal protein L14
MLQVGTLFNVIDNTGAKTAKCIRVKKGFKSKYAYFGDIILVSIKDLRTKRRESIKVKKGEMYKALILRTNTTKFLFTGDLLARSKYPSIILLNKQNKILGTRIFGSVFKKIRSTKYIKVLMLGSGLSSF